MWEFNQSLRYDKRMHAEDIQGSIAYAKALKLAGVLTNDEMLEIVNGLKQVGEEWNNQQVCMGSMSAANPIFSSYLKFEIKPEDEDIHTANERRLKELVGPVGGKLHTGRSRNDQVATDMRLWLINEIHNIEEALRALLLVMVERADKEKAHLLPGYTHLQVRHSGHFPNFLLILCDSVPFPFGGHISSSHTRSHFIPTCNACSSLFPAFLFYLWVVVLLPAIPF